MDLLVVDTDQAFGELIRQTLEATGLYRVHVATASAEALNAAFQYPIRLAIVELDRLDTPAEPFLRSLRLANPKLVIYAIPSAGSTLAKGIKVDGVFPKPFYLPDLPRLVSEAVGLPPEASRPVPFGPPQSSSERQSEPEPDWLSDAGRAQEQLTRAVLPTAARASALIRNDRLWAISIQADSGLSRNQLAPLISTASDVHTRGSLTRFFRPPGLKEDYVAYITPVSRELALIALFGRETPLGTARRTGEGLVNSLRKPTVVLPPPAAQQAPPAPTLRPRGSTMPPASRPSVIAMPPPTRPASPERMPSRPGVIAMPPPTRPAGPEPSRPAVIAMPPPTRPPEPEPPSPPAPAEPEPGPPPVQLPGDWVPIAPASAAPPSWLDRVVDTVASPAGEDSLPAVTWPEDWVPVGPALPGVDSLLEQPPSPPVEAPAAEPEPVTEAVAMPPDWIPEAPMQSEQLPFLDGPSMAPSSGPAGPPPIRLPLFTLLLPRYSEHELTGELAERLRSWTTRLCLAWDWVAERIEVLPDRLEITLILPPDESPAHAVQELRDGLSERVLRSFPELALDLPSRRFWSSSYLLRAGPAPPSGEIEAFVRETRLAQTGLTIA